MIPVLVGLAGGLGAAARFSLDSWITSRWRAPLPVGTVIINVTGSLLLGLLTGWALRTSGADVLAVGGTGLLGGYTTFSTTSFETVRLLGEKRYVVSIANAVGTLIVTVTGAALGYWAGSLF